MKKVHPLELRLAVVKGLRLKTWVGKKINKSTIENYKHTSTLPERYSEE